jgi:hypothetical protein
MADALPVAELVHGMPDRSRLRIAARRGENRFFDAVAAELSAHPSVTKVDVAALTGSVLIRHSAPLAEIVGAAEKAGLFRVAAAATGDPISPPLERPKLPVDPKLALAAGLGLAALWQVGKGKALPPALTLLWYAARLSGLGASAQAFDEIE